MSSDYDYSRYTPVDNTGYELNIFKSAYKNIRFALQTSQKYTVTIADQANLVGISFRLYGDTSLWRVLLRFNGLSDAVQEIYPGLVLNIPSKASIIDYLSKQQSNNTTSFTI